MDVSEFRDWLLVPLAPFVGVRTYGLYPDNDDCLRFFSRSAIYARNLHLTMFVLTMTVVALILMAAARQFAS